MSNTRLCSLAAPARLAIPLPSSYCKTLMGNCLPLIVGDARALFRMWIILYVVVGQAAGVIVEWVDLAAGVMVE